MIVPEYWSEAKQRITHEGKTLTIMRMGWSDESESDARANAEERLAEAIDKIRAGGEVRKVDHKVAYNGAEGLPIREEIIARHGDAVITRNGYGALCLNTPDVLFADVDVEARDASGITVFLFYAMLFIGIGIGWFYGSWALFFLVGIGGALAAIPVGFLLHWVWRRSRPDPFDIARDRILRFSASHPDWHLRVYRTPAGYRVLVMHQTFEPRSDEVQGFMKAIDTDWMYVRMCNNQNCFRARVSPKPWRIGIKARIGPRPGVWPLRPQHLPRRKAWVTGYDLASEKYSSCRFVEQLGDTRIDRKCESVRAVHDRYCKADSQLEIA